MAPISYQYNFGIQREVAQRPAGRSRLHRQRQPSSDGQRSQPEPGSAAAHDARATRSWLRPFPQFNNVTWINPSIGNSTYHGGFIRAEKRMSGGFSFLAHYTFSKFLDDVEAANEFGTHRQLHGRVQSPPGQGPAAAAMCRTAWWLTLLYEVPQFGQSPAEERLLGGWKLGLLETAESGPPFTVITTANTTNAFPAGSLRPNLLRDAALCRPISAPSAVGSTRRPSRSGAAHLRQLAALGSARRAGRDHRRDAGEELPVTERFRFRPARRILQPLNHAIFNVPGFTFGAADFGVVSSARPGRTVQLAARLSF